ncbi:hypothetical protein [Nonomuraea sp. NPDC050643]|uniref:hypothetical protein n=1 Tax=Nonomuraea sp. NPDC050643 TaxID=3155660 RepID=UPI0034042969
MFIRRAAAVVAGCAATLALAVPVTAQAATTGTVDLVRYYNSPASKHYSTTGQVPGGYKREGAVTILAQPVRGAIPIYGCMAGGARNDQYISLHRNCEGAQNTFIKLEGYLYANPTGRFTRPIYRCYWAQAQSHFYSIKADCETTATTKVTAEGRMGYVLG